jgi:hypothetical protein
MKNKLFSIKYGDCITLGDIKKIPKEYDDFPITTFDRLEKSLDGYWDVVGWKVNIASECDSDFLVLITETNDKKIDTRFTSNFNNK